MNHADHVRLLRNGVSAPGGVWADLGSGSGAFTLALAELLGLGGTIYSVDKDRAALVDQERVLSRRFPETAVYYLAADFTRPITLPALDGLVMANTLHFQRDKEGVLKLVKSYLKTGGRLLLVEYNVDSGNLWVPHPLSYATWQAVARRLGFEETQLLTTHPSRFLKEIFSAVSY